MSEPQPMSIFDEHAYNTLKEYARDALKKAEAENAALKAENEALKKESAHTIRLAQSIEEKWPKERDALKAECERLLSVLSSLSSWVGSGLGDDKRTAEQYEQRIREGVDTLIRVETQRVAKNEAVWRDEAANLRAECERLQRYGDDQYTERERIVAGLKAECEKLRAEVKALEVRSDERDDLLISEERQQCIRELEAMLDVEYEKFHETAYFVGFRAAIDRLRKGGA